MSAPPPSTAKAPGQPEPLPRRGVRRQRVNVIPVGRRRPRCNIVHPRLDHLRLDAALDHRMRCRVRIRPDFVEADAASTHFLATRTACGLAAACLRAAARNLLASNVTLPRRQTILIGACLHDHLPRDRQLSEIDADRQLERGPPGHRPLMRVPTVMLPKRRFGVLLRSRVAIAAVP